MVNGERVTLLSNSAAATGAAVVWGGGKAFFMAEATWGGGSIKLQCATPQGTFFDVASMSLTANGMLAVELPAGTYKAVAAGAGLSAGYAWLIAFKA